MTFGDSNRASRPGPRECICTWETLHEHLARLDGNRDLTRECQDNRKTLTCCSAFL